MKAYKQAENIMISFITWHNMHWKQRERVLVIFSKMRFQDLMVIFDITYNCINWTQKLKLNHFEMYFLW